MSERLPSTRRLDMMSELDRFWTLQRIADELRQEREHILSGYYRPGPGHTRDSILASNRRRLARVFARAAEFDLGIGQPDPATA